MVQVWLNIWWTPHSCAEKYLPRQTLTRRWIVTNMKQEYKTDLDSILSTQHVNGGKYWSTSDGGIGKGVPFSTQEAGMMLYKIEYNKQSDKIKRIADLLFQNVKNDGRIKVYPSGAIYPRQTANAARTLCYLGYAKEQRLIRTTE